MGMFYRTIRMLENGIKPVYVFDGKPPQLKSGEVCSRVILVPGLYLQFLMLQTAIGLRLKLVHFYVCVTAGEERGEES